MSDTDRFIRLREVENIIGLKNSQIYQMIKDGTFPRPLKLGGASRWSLASIRDWMSKQIAEAA